jgi:hypothetical protein
MIVRGFAGNIAAFVAATLFGASVVATRVAVQSISLPVIGIRKKLGLG